MLDLKSDKYSEKRSNWVILLGDVEVMRAHLRPFSHFRMVFEKILLSKLPFLCSFGHLCYSINGCLTNYAIYPWPASIENKSHTSRIFGVICRYIFPVLLSITYIMERLYLCRPHMDQKLLLNNMFWNNNFYQTIYISPSFLTRMVGKKNRYQSNLRPPKMQNSPFLGRPCFGPCRWRKSTVVLA